MSQDERLMILQMVADKKISATEAAELLKALDGKESAAQAFAGAPPVPGAPAAPAAPTAPGALMVPVPPVAPDASAPQPPRAPSPPPGPGLGTGLSSFIEEIVDRVTSAFGEFSGPRYEFPTDISGLFTEEQVPLRILTGNGHVELKGWDQPGYKASILVKARGANEAEARARAQEAYLVRADEKGFELEANRRYDWSDLVVSVTLFLPKEKLYRLETRTGNGHILVEGVTLVEGSGTSGNGRITFRGGAADRLYVKSGNGSIEIDGDVADLEAGTGNGAVRVIPLGRRSESMQVKTGNGSITIDTGKLSREVGLFIDTHTGMGSVKIGRNDLVYERDERNMGHKHVVARSEGYDSAERRVSVRARTGLGSIAVE